MFTRFYARNLKVWGDQLWREGVPLAPVTLLLGANSAGKSSLVQLPLLLKQTFESPDRQLDLNLGGQTGDLIDFGAYHDIVHAHDPARELGLGFEYRGALRDGTEATLTYRTTYTLASGAPVSQRLDLGHDQATYSVERQSKGGYLLAAPDYAPRMVSRRPDARRTFKPERSLMFSAEALAELGEAAGPVQDLGLNLGKAVGRIAYLGPLRERPERSYMWSRQHPHDLGSRGERAAQALLASENAPGRTRSSEPGDEGGKGWLVQQVSCWLERMGVGERLVLERQGRSRFFEVIVESGGQRANITDVGFGLSQVLPMLVLAHLVPRGATIVAEQPEIHLHPRAQVGLAELMVEVARLRGVQFIVETHSEHIFRRLQYLIADERVRAEDCALYFIDRDVAGQAVLQRLKADDYGRLDAWPRHFFGDALGETERQMRRMMERMVAGRQP